MFVRTLKRDYVRVSPVPDAETVLRQLPSWLAHYNEIHPHRAFGYRSPREFIARSTPRGPVRELRGNNTDLLLPHRIRFSAMRIFTMILLLAVIALGTDAIVYNGTYSQAAWRKLSDYTLELRGPTNQPAPAPTENRLGG